MTGKATRVSIGFEGGQVLHARLASEQLAALRGALGSDGWLALEAEDGTVHVDLDEVVYVLVDKEEPRVGFGT